MNLDKKNLYKKLNKKIVFCLILFVFIFNILILNIFDSRNNIKVLDKSSKEVVVGNPIILSGDSSSLLLIDNFDKDRTKTLYMWGRNDKGQLGDGTTSNKNKPTSIDVDGDGIRGNEKIVDISFSGKHTGVILENKDETNTLYMWGNNNNGQIGSGSLDPNILLPTPIDVDGDGIPGNEKLSKISLGLEHSGVVLDNKNGTKSLYTWGDNTYGQLGDWTNLNKNKPQRIDINGDLISGFENISNIYMGRSHSSALLDNKDGTKSLYMWGANNYGQLGDGMNDNRNKAFLIDVDGDGTPGNEEIVDISLGGYHSSVVLKNTNGLNKLFLWGRNNYGQLGDGTNIDKYIPTPIDINGDGSIENENILGIYMGNLNSSAIIKDENNSIMYTWGSNINDNFKFNIVPTPVDTNNNSDLSDEKVVSVALGFQVETQNFYLTIFDDGNNNYLVYSWGFNWYGQIGDGTYNKRNEPVLIFEFSNSKEISSGRTNYYLFIWLIVLAIIVIMVSIIFVSNFIFKQKIEFIDYGY